MPHMDPFICLFVCFWPFLFIHLLIFGFLRASICTTEPHFQYQPNHSELGMESPCRQWGKIDVTYRILCKRCSWEQGECVPCGSNIGYMPQQTGLEDNYVTVMDLLAHANYTFEVEAVNGVSDLSRSQRLFAAVSVTTGQAGMFSCLSSLSEK